MLKKNSYFEATCVDMTHDGKGVVKVDGFPYFVSGMITGEVGELKVIKILKNYGIARLIKVLEASIHRITPKCSIYKACGGCHLQHLDREGQQAFKTKRVEDTLHKIGDCHVLVEPCLMMEEPWFYRNKVQMPIGYDKDSNLITGFYKQRTNDIISCSLCYIQNEISNAITNDVRKLMQKYHIKPYNKETKKGNIRHILTKYGNTTKELMLVLITKENEISHIQDIISVLTNKYPNLKTIIQNINQRTDNVILGESVNVLYGDGYIEDILLGNTFKISLHSFYQVNPIQVETLYTIAINYAQLSKEDIVIDAYCGIGTIALSVAKYVKKVLGVEIVPQAIADAKENAKINSIDNVDFKCIDAGEYMQELAEEQKHVDVVFVDPPRKGCSVQFLDALITLQPKKVIYISCDVATQARDIKYLEAHGFKADMCQPVDMFPHTHHIEVITVLHEVTTK